MKRNIAKKYKIQLFYLICNHFSARIDDQKKKDYSICCYRSKKLYLKHKRILKLWI